MGERTPGPWRESWDYKMLNDKGWVIANAVGPQHICVGLRLGDSQFYRPDAATMEKVFADARLIAAAPDMLTALKAVIARADHMIAPSVIFDIHQAIAKAEASAAQSTPDGGGDNG